MNTTEKLFAFGAIAIILACVLGAGYWFFFGSNAAARRFGGTQQIKLEKGQKFVNMTWKDESLWIITRPMHQDENAEKYEFKEHSNLGVLNGKVLVEEQK